MNSKGEYLLIAGGIYSLSEEQQIAALRPLEPFRVLDTSDAKQKRTPQSLEDRITFDELQDSLEER